MDKKNMDKKNMKQRIASLHQVKSLRGKKQVEFIKQCEESCIDAICEGCFNIIRGGVKLTPKQLEKAIPYKLNIRKLGDPNISTKVKRDILSQKGSGVLGIVASLVLPLLMKALKR